MAVGRLGQISGRMDAHELLRCAVNLPLRTQERDGTHFVDVDDAGCALDLFRQDVSNGPVFSEKWQSSGMPLLSRWLTLQQETSTSSTATDTTSTTSTTPPPHPALNAHIHSILQHTLTSITLAEKTSHAQLLSLIHISEPTRPY